MKKKKSKASRIALAIAAGMLFMIVLIIGIVFIKARDYYNASNYVEDENAMDGYINPDDIQNAESIEDIKDIEGIEDVIEGIEDMDSLDDLKDTGIFEILTPEEPEVPVEPTAEPTVEPTRKPEESISIKSDKNVYNVLLIGVDRRNKGWAGNSDSMILMSLNYDKKQISMTSLMRDTYVSVPGYGKRKLNAAHAYGAGPLLLKTVEQNFKVDVNRYATVDFSSLSTIIDKLGGITLKISDAEAKSANGSIAEQCSILGLDPSSYYFSGGGNVHCNGIQAVAYARIRYVGNYDYERTERQRIVLTKMLDKFKSMSVSQMMDFAKGVLPLVTHNIPESEIWDLLGKAPSLLQYSMVRDRIPYDGLYRSTYINGQNVLVPTWDKTIKKLQNTLY